MKKILLLLALPFGVYAQNPKPVTITIPNIIHILPDTGIKIKPISEDSILIQGNYNIQVPNDGDTVFVTINTPIKYSYSSIGGIGYILYKNFVIEASFYIGSKSVIVTNKISK